MLILAAALPGWAQNNLFAIIIDSDTYAHCRDAVNLYQRAVESDGLSACIKASDWKSPDEVKSVLKDLYDGSNLEGAVFVGDIPIPMIMHAQFMTSAYKMDERKFPPEVVAVPSDRYYDDFDLKFNPLPDIEPQGLMHFYELDAESTPVIRCDIYTGRIMAQQSNGDKYAQIDAYLRKAAAAHYESNPLDQMTSYTGHGSYSDDITAWASEAELIGEQFGDVFTHNNARFLRYSMAPYIKDNIIKELRRPDLDYVVFHEHGDYFRMYLSIVPPSEEPDERLRSYLETTAHRSPENAAAKAEQWGLDSTWFCSYNDPERVAADSLEDLRSGIVLEDVNAISPNAKFVIFDACYNGDFHNPDFIAGKFIMAPGQCVVGYANSVNVLQDKSAFEFLGLLGRGARVGLWAQNQQILESHIIGDPTFHFTPYTAGDNVNSLLTSTDMSLWRSQLLRGTPDMQCVAMTKLFNAGYQGISGILLDRFKNSPYAVVRYRALVLLEHLADASYNEALKLGIHDSFEFIRRISVNRMGRVGAEEFIPYIIESYVTDRNCARVIFNAKQSLASFDSTKVISELDKWFEGKSYYNASKDRSELMAIAQDNAAAQTLEVISDRDSKKVYRLMYVDFMRNCPYHQNTTELIRIMKDPTEDPDLRTRIAESFGWYTVAYNRGEIISACRELLNQGGTPSELTRALKSAVTRLSSTL